MLDSDADAEGFHRLRYGRCAGEARRGVLWRAVLLIAALLVPLQVFAAASWWNSDWQYRKSITIKMPSTTEGGAASSVVLPVRLHAGNFEYFADLQPGGADLRFVAADGTPLKYQIELIDLAVGLVIAWVEVPVRTGASQEQVWMYYGNPHATAPVDTNLYDADQVLVLHLGESKEAPRDATANHYDAAASTAQAGVPGVLGNGLHFNGRDFVRIAARPALGLTPNGGFTLAGWLKPDSAASGGVLYSQAKDESTLEIGIADSRLYAYLKQGDQVTRIESTKTVAAGRWSHVAVSIGPDVALYIDGVPAGSMTSPGLPEVRGDVHLGARSEELNGGAGFTGALDEIEISKTARSPWWVQVNALAQSPESTLTAYGTDESRGSSGKFAAYLAMMRNLLSQVSLDGLVVITITSLMGLASFYALASKAALLRRVEREDARFLGEFPARLPRDAAAVTLGGPAAAIDVDERYRASGLFEMYRSGLTSLEAVAAAQRGGRGGLRLTHEAFEAIRAGLDAALVEATNRLNARLVIMTVAIAGAPFLGLLGTVVGVMITFASIAAAGDVNVNTIAPGVAAAMTATVVGLLVAIPSLFGYNWIATRVARRTSAMEVFADQFVSRLGLLALTSHMDVSDPEALRRTEESEEAANEA